VVKKHRGQPLKFLVGGVLAHIEDLRHERGPFLLRI
jgi:hypothetical protein